MITIFKTLNDTQKPYYISVESAIERIKNGESKAICESIRLSSNKEERNKIKKKLPAVCFGGKFSSREDDALTESSGYMSIDFDDFESDEKLDIKRFELEMDDYTSYLFLSPSGNGLKILVKIPMCTKEEYKKYFKAIEKYYNSPNFDKSCSNISRITYESYDPNVFINPSASTWTEQYSEPVKEKVKTMFPIEDEDKAIKILKTWWQKDFGMVSGSRNHNLFILAASFNDYGIQKADAINACMEYEAHDFPEEEIKQTVDSAYASVEKFGTKQFEDNEKVSSVAEMIVRSVPVDEIKLMHPTVTDEIIRQIRDTVIVGDDFWFKTDKGIVKFINHKYRDFLTDNGFYKYYHGSNERFIFVRIIDNIMTPVSDNQIRDFVFGYLNDIEDRSIDDAYAEKTKMGEERFLGFLENADPVILKDRIDSANIYYNNCAIRVYRDKIEPIAYNNLEGNVWSKQIINRDFKVVEFHDCEFRQFIRNVSGNDDVRMKSMESTIGFLLHSYKPADYCPIVILNDESISSKPEGGTGKGIFIHAISKMKNNVTIDGKSFTASKNFNYQRVNTDTQVLTFQDIEKTFNLEKLFSISTDGITVEKKNQQEIYIEFEDSPKMIISTNYAVKGEGNSFERRKWELEFAQYYNKDFTPFKEFGHTLFNDWTDEEYLKFDNYMLYCLQTYLTKGFIEAEFKNLELRKLESSTSYEFREWVTSSDARPFLLPNCDLIGQDVMNEFTTNYPDFGQFGKYKLPHRTFYDWLNKYAIFKYGEPYVDRRGSNGKMIRFTSKEKQTKLF
jgi:hypothetical protein